MSSNSFTINFSWGSRAESPAQLGERLLRSVEALSEIDPLFQSWWFVDLVEREYVPFDQARPRITGLIEQGVQRDDDDEPEPSGGYSCSIVSNTEWTPEKVELRMHGGVDGGRAYFGNDGVFTTEYSQIPNPAIITYPIFKSVMMAMVRVWGPASAMSFCSDLIEDRQKSRRVFGPGWMTYLAPPLATRITPPAGVLCERTTDGGLLLIAAEETFDTANPSHMAAAWAISDALAPINGPEFRR